MEEIINETLIEMFKINPTELPSPNGEMMCECIKCNCNPSKCKCILNKNLTQHILDSIKLRNNAKESNFHIFNQKVANYLELYKNIKNKEIR